MKYLVTRRSPKFVLWGQTPGNLEQGEIKSLLELNGFEFIKVWKSYPDFSKIYLEEFNGDKKTWNCDFKIMAELTNGTNWWIGKIIEILNDGDII